VEDESSIRRLLVHVLGRVGYRIQSVAEGALAIRILEDDPEIDLVFTDLAMPGMDGREVAEWLVRTRPEVKVVCMSGSPDDRDGKLGRMLEKCLVHFLPKPFLPSQVLLLAQRLLGGK
jgi:CheY-like chemotaxis protein